MLLITGLLGKYHEPSSECEFKILSLKYSYFEALFNALAFCAILLSLILQEKSIKRIQKESTEKAFMGMLEKFNERQYSFKISISNKDTTSVIDGYKALRHFCNGEIANINGLFKNNPNEMEAKQSLAKYREAILNSETHDYLFANFGGLLYSFDYVEKNLNKQDAETLINYFFESMTQTDKGLLALYISSTHYDNQEKYEKYLDKINLEHFEHIQRVVDAYNVFRKCMFNKKPI